MFKQHYAQVTSSLKSLNPKRNYIIFVTSISKCAQLQNVHNLPGSFKKSLRVSSLLLEQWVIFVIWVTLLRNKDVLVIQYFVILKWHFETLKIKKNNLLISRLSPMRNKPQRFREFSSSKHAKVLMDLYRRHTIPLRHSDRYFHTV